MKNISKTFWEKEEVMYYVQLIPILIKWINQDKQEIERLKYELSELRGKLNQLEKQHD